LLGVYFTDANTGIAVGEGGTILRTTNGGVTGIEDNDTFTQPTDFVLEQNFPNPFNPSTTFQFSIPSSQFTVLKVYDLIGREVATLVDEQKPAGSHSVRWEASGIASGVYLYKLQSGWFVQTKKLLLLH
jgi:hypothetical protein